MAADQLPATAKQQLVSLVSFSLFFLNPSFCHLMKFVFLAIVAFVFLSYGLKELIKWLFQINNSILCLVSLHHLCEPLWHVMHVQTGGLRSCFQKFQFRSATFGKPLGLFPHQRFFFFKLPTTASILIISRSKFVRFNFQFNSSFQGPQNAVLLQKTCSSASYLVNGGEASSHKWWKVPWERIKHLNLLISWLKISEMLLYWTWYLMASLWCAVAWDL